MEKCDDFNSGEPLLTQKPNKKTYKNTKIKTNV